MAYRDKYQSIQLNVSKEKNSDLIEWLYEESKKEDRSLNLFIIRVLKEERKRREASQKAQQ